MDGENDGNGADDRPLEERIGTEGKEGARPDERSIAEAYAALGAAYLATGENEAAYNALRAGLTVAAGTLRREEAIILIGLARATAALGKKDEAEFHWRRLHEQRILFLAPEDYGRLRGAYAEARAQVEAAGIRTINRDEAEARFRTRQGSN